MRNNLIVRSIALAGLAGLLIASSASANRISSVGGSLFFDDVENVLVTPTDLFQYGRTFQASMGFDDDIDDDEGNLLFTWVNEGDDWGMIFSHNYGEDPNRIFGRTSGGHNVYPSFFSSGIPNQTGLMPYEMFNADYVRRNGNGAFSVGLGVFNNVNNSETDDGTTVTTNDLSAMGFAVRGGWANGPTKLSAELTLGGDEAAFDNGTTSTTDKSSNMVFAVFGEHVLNNGVGVFGAVHFGSGDLEADNGDKDEFSLFNVIAGVNNRFVENSSRTVIADMSLMFLSDSNKPNGGAEFTNSTFVLPKCGVAYSENIWRSFHLDGSANYFFAFDSSDNDNGAGTTSTFSDRDNDFIWSLGGTVVWNDNFSTSFTFDPGNLDGLLGFLGDDGSNIMALQATGKF